MKDLPKQIIELLGEDWLIVQQKIREGLKSDIQLLNQTNESLLEHSGKQLRPILSLLVSKACSSGKRTDLSLRYAAASELLHNATLLHDDVADGSESRRGYPTIMSLMGPGVAVLLGDYWLVKAMEQIIGLGETDTSIIRIFAKTLSDLAEGEMLQLEKANSCDTTEEDYLRIIYSKTASLFEATMVSAALSVNAPEDVVEAIREYSVSLGYAFQIKDDILDYNGNNSVGKPTGVDILAKKITLPLLGALSAVSKEEQEEIREKIRNIDEDSKAEIIAFVKDKKGVEYSLNRIDEYVSKAISALDRLPESQEKACLVELAYYTGKRHK